KEKSEIKNEKYATNTSRISAYAIAQDCISSVVKKILNYPVQSYADKWLPLVMRATIGTAIHDTIQKNSNQFTETEVSVKVPSIRFSGRLDGLIGNNVLCEIKSCPYKDYEWIIKNQQPRKSDFYQLMVYKYVIENYLEESKTHNEETRTPPPKYDNYDFNTLQFIYVAHDMFSSDVDSFSEALAIVKRVKQMLNSRRNDMFFMTSVVLDTNCFDVAPYMKYIKEKIERINYYLDNNKIPPADDPYIDRKKCFFCLYKDNCEVTKK
ncbi:MAG: hypothetical protein ACOC22_03260, partial [bacterium]